VTSGIAVKDDTFILLEKGEKGIWMRVEEGQK
jgi:hypothetical protein